MDMRPGLILGAFFFLRAKFHKSTTAASRPISRVPFSLDSSPLLSAGHEDDRWQLLRFGRVGARLHENFTPRYQKKVTGKIFP